MAWNNLSWRYEYHCFKRIGHIHCPRIITKSTNRKHQYIRF